MATSSTQSGFIDNWQRGKSVTKCNLHMLETEDFTDVTFLVGSEKHVVRAHRYVLVSRSSVFHAMFCGSLAEQREITIPDIEVNVFRDFLRFLYTDTYTINTENVTGLLYTSRKYDVETLFTKSTAFLKNSLCEDNLCEILEKSHGYGETDLEQRALTMLSQAGPKVIMSAGFLELCSGCFGTLLESRILNLEEEKIFEAALSWTKAECSREGLSPSHENMRKILGEMVYEVRFVTLSLDYIAKVVGPSGILTGDERLNIMDRILKSSNDISPFKSDNRRKYYVKRFKNVSGAGSCSFKGHYFAISFSASKNITILGCQLYGSHWELTRKIDIKLMDDQKKRIYHTGQDTNMTLSNRINDVMFPDSVSIQAGRVYTICVTIPKYSNIVSGSGGVSKVSEEGVEFTFMDSENSWGKTSIESGHIPGLIWR